MTTVEGLEAVRRAIQADPVAGYVALTVAAANATPNFVVSQVGGRDIRLPPWSRREWFWWAQLALVSERKTRADLGWHGHGKAALDRGRAAVLAALPVEHDETPMTPVEAGRLYYEAVKLMIACVAALTGKRVGALLWESLTEAWHELPATLGMAAGEMGAAALRGVYEAAKRILKEAFKHGGGTVLLILAGLGLWLWSRRGRN